MKVGDIVEFRCPQIFMEKKFEIRGVGVLLEKRERYDKSHMFRSISFKVQWISGEVTWEHDTYLEGSYESR